MNTKIIFYIKTDAESEKAILEKLKSSARQQQY